MNSDKHIKFRILIKLCSKYEVYFNQENEDSQQILINLFSKVTLHLFIFDSRDNHVIIIPFVEVQ